MLPFLLGLVLITIEGGYLFRAHTALVNATWVGARFALDGGSDSDVVLAIQNNSSGVSIVEGRADIYIVRGTTDSAGNIASWTPSPRVFGTGAAQPRTTQADVQAGINSWPTAANIGFVLVEVDYQYEGVTGALPVSLPLKGYAIVRRL